MRKKKDDKEPVIEKQEVRRNFATNQSIKLGEIPAIVEGYCADNHVLVRVHNIQELDKASEKYLKQFNCLLSNAKLSRLYTIDESILMRQNEQQKRQVVESLEKRTKHKR